VSILALGYIVVDALVINSGPIGMIEILQQLIKTMTEAFCSETNPETSSHYCLSYCFNHTCTMTMISEV